MSLKTLEVELDDGRITPSFGDALPGRAKALLTILAEDNANGSSKRPSLKDLQPSSVGTVLRAYPEPDDDMLAEMISPDE